MTSSSFGDALGELPELGIEVDLVLPDRGVHRAPAFGLRARREREFQHRVERLALVLGVEVGELLDQIFDRLVAIGGP